MWTKKIIVSNHVKERFEQRNIKFSQKTSIEEQIRYDLRALNVREKVRLNNLEYRVTTRQGKVYILKEINPENKIIVKTVYKIDLRKQLFCGGQVVVR